MIDESHDYYELLGIEPGAETAEIKAAFKRMALKYHPDVYDGPDAEERMRLLLAAYKTLTDPSKRKTYDLAHGIVRRRPLPREEAFGFFRSPTGRGFTAWSGPLPTPGKAAAAGNTSPPTTPATEPSSQDTERNVAVTFPRLEVGAGVVIALDGFVYTLTPQQAARLREDGRLLGADLPQRLPSTDGTTSGRRCTCHRCGHSWIVPPEQRRTSTDRCPQCAAPDWAEYLLLRCQECTAVFESRQIRRYDRVKIGERYYGDYHLCSPYELFPKCPNCQAVHWCAGEEMRLSGRKPPISATGPLPQHPSLRTSTTGSLPRISTSGGIPRFSYTGAMSGQASVRARSSAQGSRVPKALLTLIMALMIAGMLLAIYAIALPTR